jgi:hypothetical protein
VGGVEVGGGLRELVAERVQNLVELGVHGVGVGLVIGRVQRGPGPPSRGFRRRRHQVGGVVKP